MAVSSLDITFDAPEANVHPDEALTGRIHVEAAGDCQCRSLEIARYLEVRGPDETERASEETAELFSGRWEEGRTYSYPFSLSLPNGPYSYEGRDLQLEWFAEVRVRLDSGEPVDRRRELTLDATAGPVDAPYRIGDAQALVNRDLEPDVELEDVGLKARLPTRTRGMVLLTLAGLGLIGAVLELWSVGEWITDREIPCFLLLLLAGMGGYGALIIYNSYRERLRHQTLEDVVVDLDRVVAAGETSQGRIAIESPSAPGHIRSAKATLICREKSGTDGQGGPSRSTIVHRDEQVVDDSRDRRISKGEPVDLEFALAVPADGPPSFHGAEHRVEWTAVVQLDVDGWRDWTETIPMTVAPVGQEAMTREG